MWEVKSSNRFESSYEKLGKDMTQRVDAAIQTLLNADKPERCGIAKKGSRKGYFSYELGRSCRIIYRPLYDQKKIEFLRVCSHKEAYAP